MVCYGSWCTDAVLVTTKLLCDVIAHDASGLSHNVGSIRLVLCSNLALLIYKVKVLD